MSQIAPKQFYDDIDNFHEIRVALKRRRYEGAFKFLYSYFYNEHHTWVDVASFRKALCISLHVEPYHILGSMVVLNLLEKKRLTHKRVIFIPINQAWWDIFKKEMDKDGFK